LKTRIEGDGKRFVVRADEKLTAFLELESGLQKVSAQLEASKPTLRAVLNNQ
jgi:hypothetical protein